jgi:hypothetical protein
VTADQEFYERAIRRIYRNLVALSLAGTLAAAALKGTAVGAGFLIGGGGAILLFYWFHRLVSGLSGTSARRPPLWLAWGIGFRYLIIGGAAYVMMKYLGINSVALVAGLLVIAPAILVEILYELIFVRS